MILFTLIYLLQSNEVANSGAMELEGLKRSFKLIQSHNLQVSHLITDRHCQVKKYMKTQQPGVKHYFDVWHVAKGKIKATKSCSKYSNGS